MLGKRDVIVHGTDPYNAETERAALAEGPAHRDRGVLRAQPRRGARRRRDWRLRVDGVVERPLDLSLATLREALPEHTVTATLQCAGNRRAGLIAIRDIPGEAPWGPGATGTARGRARGWPTCSRWPGRWRAAHVGFQGADLSPEAKPPQRVRRLDPAREGAPARGAARVGDERRAARARPRRAAARGRPRLHRRAQHQVARPDRAAHAPRGRATSRRSSTGCCPRTARRRPGPGCRSAWSRSTPTSSPATAPTGGRGYAFAGGERFVTRVDVSTDGGATWTQAELLDDLGPWAWRHWRAPARPAARRARARRPRLGLLRRHPARGRSLASGTRRATSTTPRDPASLET